MANRILWRLCQKGHSLTPENTYFVDDPWNTRRCRTCNADNRLTANYIKMGFYSRRRWLKRQGKNK